MPTNVLNEKSFNPMSVEYSGPGYVAREENNLDPRVHTEVEKHKETNEL